ncbi:Uncharacterized protein Rs2_06579 [Raphanus sativus]|nr:Uncharacterized protein Rs2_06579 [Raphanus sativus]
MFLSILGDRPISTLGSSGFFSSGSADSDSGKRWLLQHCFCRLCVERVCFGTAFCFLDYLEWWVFASGDMSEPEEISGLSSMKLSGELKFGDAMWVRWLFSGVLRRITNRFVCSGENLGLWITMGGFDDACPARWEDLHAWKSWSWWTWTRGYSEAASDETLLITHYNSTSLHLSRLSYDEAPPISAYI